MKIVQLFIAISLITIFSGCNKDREFVTYAVPQTKSLQDIRNSVSVDVARATNADGKIYVTTNLLFYIAQESGVHIFDNRNPSNPVNTAFINLEGVHDIAVKGNYLFADNYVDLLVFDISDIHHINLVKTVANSVEFTAGFPRNAEYYDYEVYPKQDEIITGYTTEIRKRPKDSYKNVYYEDGLGPVMENSNGSVVGTGGSYARFQINGNALYTTESFNLKVFDISQPTQSYFLKPVYMQTWFGGGEFETLYKQGDYLFVGSTNGMYVVDATDEFNPQFISGFSHATSCDPVVVNGNTAYITLRGGTTCNATIEDQVNVIDISDISNPTLVSTYLLNHPLGLGIKNTTMYVCCGADGLKVFDATNSADLTLKNTYIEDLTDVIPLNSHLIAVGKNKIIQYAYGDDFTLEPISVVNF